jgi:hypothetical protein
MGGKFAAILMLGLALVLVVSALPVVAPTLADAEIEGGIGSLLDIAPFLLALGAFALVLAAALLAWSRR